MNLEEGDFTPVRIVRLGSSRCSSTTNGTNGMVSKCLDSLKKIFEPHEKHLGSWIFLILCVFSLTLDPFFFFIPVITKHKNCLALNKRLGITTCILRSVIDLSYVIYISFQQQTEFPIPRHMPHSVGNYDRPIVRKLLHYRVVDILAVLPLPQVVVIIVIATMRGSKFLKVMHLLKFFVFFQYVPRIIRIYPLFRRATKNIGIFSEAMWSKAPFNFLLYINAGLVYGALWYFLAIEREVDCWRKACKSHTGCNSDSIDCHISSENHAFFNDFCSTETQNVKIFDFGIFRDAIQSDILRSSNSVQKSMYCFKWGLQSLSCFGQNLETSTGIMENIFAITITISSTLIFIFLIGNMQVYLQAKATKSEEKKLDRKLEFQQLEKWMHLKGLPVPLQKKVKKFLRRKWQSTKRVNLDNLLSDLTEDLRTKVMRHLVVDVFLKLPLFKSIDEQYLKDRLKPVQRREGRYIFRRDAPVDKMLFITQGWLLSVGSNDTLAIDSRGWLLSVGSNDKGDIDSLVHITANDICGEELIKWALDPSSSSNLPPSSRTVGTCTYVEGFALMADDLKFVVSQFKRLDSGNQLRPIFRFYSLEWRTWAACFIQRAWLRYLRNQCAQKNRSAYGRICPYLGVTFASRFATNAFRAMRPNSTRKARIPGRKPPMPPQKPIEPDFIAKEKR